MRVCDLPEDELCIGIRVVSLADPTRHGTIGRIWSRNNDGSELEIEIYWDDRDWPSSWWAFGTTNELV